MRKFLSIVLFFMILLTMTACHITMTERGREENNSKVDKENISYNFVRDSSLDKYIDKSLQDKLLDTSISTDNNNKKDTARAIGFISGTTIGADSPTVCFVNDDYIGILCFKEILIYDKSTGKLSTVLDTLGLGFKYTQGDEAILEKADNEYFKAALIEEIVKMEWSMFSTVHNEGGKAACQMDRPTFTIMRTSQHQTWNEALLASYRDDLARAQNGLDPFGVLEVRELLKELTNNLGTTVLISSHNLEEISKVATRIVIVHEGRRPRRFRRHYLLFDWTFFAPS